MSRLLVTPDVHGRDFWIEPCEKYVNEVDKIIFLGDYHDPYPFQVSKEVSRHMLRDKLIPFVNEHNCICLFGNHDGNYLLQHEMANRIDTFHHDEIKKYLEQLNLRLIYKEDDVLFSHSGVLPGWLCNYNLTLEDLENASLELPALRAVSMYRGGRSKYGSCVWGDVREYYKEEHIPDLYQVFGHTQLKDALIEKDFACLDCRKAFIIDTVTHEINEC